MLTERELLNKFADALEHSEGFHQTRRIPTVAQRLNNPGNLIHWKQPNGEAYPEVNGFVEFPDYATGRRALLAQCRINIFKRELTWREFFAGKPGTYHGFCPKDDRRATEVKNDPNAYAYRVMAFVCVPYGVETTVDSKIITLTRPSGVAFALPKAA